MANNGESDALSASFASVVAHELRTPLTSVLGLFSVLEDGTVRLDGGEARQLAAMGRSEAERMILILENVFAASRLADGRLDVDLGPVELTAVARAALDQFPEVARRAYIPLEKSAVVIGDARLVAQVVTNLIQNVTRYAPGGQVEVRFGHGGDVVTMSVADDGPGIPAENREAVFARSMSDQGLGIGLGISRDLARAMGGDLVVAPPLRSGATFVLTLPGAPQDAILPIADEAGPRRSTVVLSPSARVLVDMTHVLAERSLDRVVTGLQRMFSNLLDASAGVLAVRTRSGTLARAGSFGSATERDVPETRVVRRVMTSGRHAWVPDLAGEEPEWQTLLGCRSALFLPVLEDEETLGVLTIGWDADEAPTPRRIEVATALARLAAFGAQRAALADDVLFERRMRSSVLEAFPIAISVFAGDPPRLIDWNTAEQRLLAVDGDSNRPIELATSQVAFDVRFFDGTPLTLDNAPVTETIRTGQSSGPFFLRLRRSDGHEVITRTYCAPFFDEEGSVAGAIVSSEKVDEADVEAEAGASRLRSWSAPAAN